MISFLEKSGPDFNWKIRFYLIQVLEFLDKIFCKKISFFFFIRYSDNSFQAFIRPTPRFQISIQDACRYFPPRIDKSQSLEIKRTYCTENINEVYETFLWDVFWNFILQISKKLKNFGNTGVQDFRSRTVDKLIWVKRC